MPVAEVEAFWLCSLLSGDVFDPRYSIEAGACILRRNLHINGGNLILALAQYNGGYAARDRLVSGGELPRETYRYVTRVLYRFFREDPRRGR